MLSFEDEVEKDIENSEIGESVTEEREEENNHDFFADVELPEDTNGELSETDSKAASPFKVSGTGALTGAMKAYEVATDQKLDEKKKDIANKGSFI